MTDNKPGFVNFASLPALTEDERDDAKFRGKDLAWSLLVGLYDEWAADNDMSYKAVGDRVDLSKQQVQRWFDAPHNMTMSSFSLLAESLDADLVIKLIRRTIPAATNSCHPADEAMSNSGVKKYLKRFEAPASPSNMTRSQIDGWATA